MIKEVLDLMRNHLDKDDFDEVDKFPKNVQDIINMAEPEYTSEDIACLNRFEIDEIVNDKLREYSREFIELCSQFTEDGINSLEELNKVYYNNFAGKLDLLFVRARKILKDNNIDIEKYKLRTAEFEDLINDTLCDCCSPLSAQRISSRIASKF